jgi:outer membrane protein assembly factor BamA
VKVNKNFLIQYLGLGDGSVYRKSVLDLVSKRIADLGFIRESRKWNLSLTGTGAILNLYLEPAQNSRFNLLAGFMPSNQQLGGKLLLTGEAEMDLKNAFGGGENIFLNWQQIQVSSPRLQLGFMKPYVFNSNTGVDFNFNLFRKDSSFLTLNTRIGLRYEIKPRQTAKLFFNQYSSSLLDVDTLRVRQTKTLPSFVDATTSNLGVEFLYNSTDYFYNPQKGTELEFRLLGGIRKIKKNNAILQLKEEGVNAFNFNSLYDSVSLTSSQFRLVGKLNQYYKIGIQSTLKAGLQAGWIFGKELLWNELFQIGGLKNLRGFDEESLFASGYTTGTLEYRYLLSRASYLFAFVDAAYVERKTISDKIGNFYGGMGMGILLETKTGVFSLAYAAGKKPDVPINFREAKIHFGFITLF